LRGETAVADLIPSQIAPLGDGGEFHDDSGRDKPAKRPTPARPAPAPPAVDSEKEESHQLDELA
jgi:hypothetical protein